MRIWILTCVTTLFFGCATAPSMTPSHKQISKKGYPVHGVYVNLATLQSQKKLHRLIEQAKSHHINTFVVDLKSMPTARYRKAIQHILHEKIAYVPRVVLFPGGGTYAQIHDQRFWQKAWPMTKAAIALGAHAVQLDYIRYRTDTAHHTENRHDIHKIIQWYAQHVHAHHASLQLAIFGVASFHPVHTIGQDAGLFAKDADTLCPMVYPSHFEPFQKHAATPFETIKTSMRSIRKQLTQTNQLIPYLEPYNYRVPMDASKRVRYTAAQIQGAQASQVDGWFFWSANNIYQHLFLAIEQLDHEIATHAWRHRSLS